MPARRWILVPAPRPGSLAPILVAIGLLAGVGLAAFALALAPLPQGPPAAFAPFPAVPAAAPPAAPGSLAVPPQSPAHARRWM